MNIKRWLKSIFLLVPLVLLLTGCEDTTVSTEIFSDGSCLRTLKVESDSGNFFSGPFALPADESWHISTTVHKEKKDKTYILEGSKRFASVGELNEEFKSLQGKTWSIQTPITFKKRFQGLFTRYSYRETYGRIFPFQSIPIKEFFSEEEFKLIQRELRGEGDEVEAEYPKEKIEQLEEKFIEWLVRSILNDFIDLLARGADKLKDPGLDPDLIRANKETIYQELVKSTEDSELELEDFLTVSEQVLDSPQIRQIREQNRAAFEELERKTKFLDTMWGDHFSNRVAMPGLIVDTNAPSIEGRTAIWKFDPGTFLFQDYDMWVESRTLNWWFLIVAGLVLLSVLALLIFHLIRRRN